MNINGIFVDSDLLPVNNSLMERSFEQLVTERGSIQFSFIEQEPGFYKGVFDKLKESLFYSTDTYTLDHEKQALIDKKYDLVNGLNTIKELKNNVTKIYDRKLKLESEISKKESEYLKFTESIKNFVEMLNDNDENLRDLLVKKIDNLKKDLDIDSLNTEYTEVINEFMYIKEIFKDLSSILPRTVCSICLENQVSHFIDPCGHTLCLSCKVKCNTTRHCHYCRVTKNGYRPLFL